MRASDLLGARVISGNGAPLGYVSELHCSLDGPSVGPLAAPRLRALTVSTRRTGASLGYQQEDMRGPWLIRVVMRRVHRGALRVPWEKVAEAGDGVVRLRG